MTDNKQTKTDYTRFELDALGELGNMGAGAAGIALSKFLNRDVSMSLPYIRLIDETNNTEKFIFENYQEDEEIAVIRMSITNPHSFNALCLIKKDSVDKLLDILFGNFVKDDEIKDYTSLHHSLIKEVGSILILQYISAVNKLLNVVHTVTFPTLEYGEFSKVLELTEKEAQKYDDKICNIKESKLGIDLCIFTVNEEITFNLLLIPCVGSVPSIIQLLLLK